MTIHKSKVDQWFIAVVAVITLLPLGLITTAAWRAELHPVAAVGVLLIVVPSLALTLWIYRSTAYVVTDTDLLVHSGPLHVSIPLRSITAVRPTRDAIASPALSLDRLEIRYGPGKKILVSPADKPRFLAALSGAVPPGAIEA